MRTATIALACTCLLTKGSTLGSEGWIGQCVFWKDDATTLVDGKNASIGFEAFVPFPSTVIGEDGQWLILEPPRTVVAVGEDKEATGQAVELAKSVKLRTDDAMRSEEALKYFSDRIKANPSAQNYLRRAAVHRSLGKHENAADDERIAQQFQPPPMDSIAPTALTTSYSPPDPWVGQIVFWKYGAKVVDEDKESLASKAPWSSRVDGVDGDWLNVGNVRIRKGDVLRKGDAMREIRECLAESNDRTIRAEAHRKYGCIAQESRWFESAIASYEQAIVAMPTYARAYYDRGTVRFEIGEFDAALDDVSAAIRLEPACALYYLGRGHIYMAKDRPGDALTEYLQAAQFEPSNAFSYYYQGNALAKLGRLKDAITKYDQAIAIDQGKGRFYCDRGVARLCDNDNLAARSDFDEAVSRCTQSIQSDRRNPDLYVERARALYYRGNLTESARDYSEAIRLHPNSAVAYFGRANVYMKLRETAKAVRDQQQASQLDPHGYFVTQPSRPLL